LQWRRVTADISSSAVLAGLRALWRQGQRQIGIHAKL